jgi:hypothetical protein
LKTRPAASREISSAALGEVGDEAGVGAVLQDGGGARLDPLRLHPAQIHVAPVEGPLGGVLVLGPGVGVPDLDRGVDVEDAVVVAPLQDLAGVDVPGQVDEDVAGAQVLPQQAGHVLARHPLVRELHALPQPGLERVAPVLEVHHRDVPGRHADVLHQDGQRALGHGAVAHEEDALAEVDHVPGTLLERPARGMRGHAGRAS